MSKALFTCQTIVLLLLLQGCSNNNGGFHLRKSVDLAPQFETISLQGVNTATKFKTTFAEALAEAGGSVVTSSKQSGSALNFYRFDEGRRVIAYTSERTAREYLLYLKIEYSVQKKNQQNSTDDELQKFRINIDRSYLYDADFALGKAEEELRVKQALYEEATRLIMLRLKYAEK